MHLVLPSHALWHSLKFGRNVGSSTTVLGSRGSTFPGDNSHLNGTPNPPTYRRRKRLELDATYVSLPLDGGSTSTSYGREIPRVTVVTLV